MGRPCFKVHKPILPTFKNHLLSKVIITFYQKPQARSFNEAWERFKGLLRQCPHHGFSELHQLDTFYNSLNSNDQDALDSAAGGNFLDKMPQEGLAIIESKSKVRYSRSRANDSRVSTDAPLSNSSPSNNSFDMQQYSVLEDKMTIKMNQMMNQMKALVVTTPAPVKAVEEVCVTCGSNHHFNLCPLTRGGNDFPVFQDNIQQFQQTAAVGNFLQRNQPSNLASQMRPPEADAFIAIDDEPVSPVFNATYYDPEDLKVVEPKKSSVEYATSYDKKLRFPKSNLKELPPHLEYAFLEENNKLPVIISKDLSLEEKTSLINVLKNRKQAIAWKLSDIRGIDPEFCSHKILLEDDYEPSVQHQRRVNPKIHDVIKKEVEKLLDAGLIYPISDSPWVSPVHCVPKKGGYFQIPIDPKDQEKTTFTCPYGTFAYRRMPFGLCNAPGTFQRCMMAIFHDMIEKTMEVFMDDFSVFGDSFSSCLANLDKMLKRCEDTKLALNWEKSHFMVKEGIVLGHKISRKGIEVDKAKVDVISKLPHPTVKGIRSFLGHAGFYRRFIKDFSKISRPMTSFRK
ncbi:reverse transcriptase domain-containing protein [Tanacetum coccineum]|uniref:Reverse transcriptase domain-containing protein n=1 Tax=Tanacetum coccineum TaxID=301880 RepID=A0ABQ5G418_9ASTR